MKKEKVDGTMYDRDRKRALNSCVYFGECLRNTASFINHRLVAYAKSRASLSYETKDIDFITFFTRECSPVGKSCPRKKEMGGKGKKNSRRGRR